MNTRIQPLSAKLVHRIAAGEVIDSITAVVRELIDNALDARASRVSIMLWPEDWRVQVSDNGVGLSWSDLQQAALPYTTSKLPARTLDQVTTLGFRGEALHSMTQVSCLEIASRVAETATGWCVSYDAKGSILQADEIALAPGTVVTVSQLFAQWPSRRQVVPEAQMLRSLQSLIHDYALCHPQVTWQVYRGERTWFQLAPGMNAQDSLLQLLPQRSPQELRFERFTIPCGDMLPEVGSTLVAEATLEILIALPDRYHRHRADWIRTAVNGRRVSINLDAGVDTTSFGPLEQSILNAFRQTIPRHRFPLCFVHFKLPPALVDWNRTAAKSHVFLHHGEQWRDILTQHIQHMLGQVTLPDTAPRLKQLLKSAEKQGQYAIQPLVNLSAQLPDPTPAGEERNVDLPAGQLKAIAQLHNTYIVSEHPSGVWLVEQHIAHERVLYERISQNWECVTLNKPITLSNLSDRQVQNLQTIGLEVEEFGQSLWAVRTAPRPLAQRDDCEAALAELSHFQTLQPAIVATACRSAIRNGTSLTLSEMQLLLDQWQQTRSPRTCPHGRPIYLPLAETALARFFRRHWVVGKSHGIQETS